MVIRPIVLAAVLAIAATVCSPSIFAKDARRTPEVVPGGESQPDKRYVPVLDIQYNLVREVQRRLRELGYNPKGEDGLWGGNTLAALNAYRLDRGLPLSRSLDWEVVGSLLGEQTVHWQLRNAN